MDAPIRVTIVDASRDQTELLRAALEDAGFSVVAAANAGDEAYEKLLADPPDVLITDLLLPGLDGLSLLRQLREQGRLPRTILLSAFWNDRVARSAMRLGVDECLSKPCRAEVLFRLIRDIAQSDEQRSSAPDPAIRRAMMAFHISSHLDGYRYLCEGLSRVLADRSCLQGVTKSLYRDIAKVFHTNPACVERSMRTAILTGWRLGTPEQRRRSFGSVFDGYERAPSNIRFLAAMAEYLELSEHGAAYL